MKKSQLLTLPTAALIVIAGALPAMAHNFGDGPLDKVQSRSNSYGGNCSGNATPTKLKARALSIGWNEATDTDAQVPSPMTLSRYDTEQGLWWQGSQQNVNSNYRRIFWNPGVGIWQLDDAGMGGPLADGRFEAERSVAEAMDHIRIQLCNGDNPYRTPDGTDWIWDACSSGDCQTDYQEIFNGDSNPLSHFDGTFSVQNFGGSDEHQCYVQGLPPNETWPCLYVRPGQAQGFTGWTNDPKGEDDPFPRPLSNSFYVFRSFNSNGDPVETRYYMKQDTPLGHSVMVRRQIPNNSRTSLNWFNSPFGLCDSNLNQCSSG